MRRTVFVITADNNEQRWIEATLASLVDDVVLLQDGAPLLAGAATGCKACLVATAEPDEAKMLGLVRDLRARGEALPVIVPSTSLDWRPPTFSSVRSARGNCARLSSGR